MISFERYLGNSSLSKKPGSPEQTNSVHQQTRNRPDPLCDTGNCV